MRILKTICNIHHVICQYTFQDEKNYEADFIQTSNGRTTLSSVVIFILDGLLKWISGFK